MRNIWVKIGLMAAGIFAVGMVVVSAIRAGKEKATEFFHSDNDINIPLMGMVPFYVGAEHLGDLRRLTLRRDAPDHITSVRFDVRLGDSATVAPLKDCAFLTVNDAKHWDKDTRFTCITDTTGLTDFGTVEIAHRQSGEATTLVRTLMLPAAQVQEIRESMSSHNRLGPDQRARLESMRDSLEAMGDSIRAAAEAAAQRGASSTSVATPVPTPPPTPSRPAQTAPKASTPRH